MKRELLSLLFILFFSFSCTLNDKIATITPSKTVTIRKNYFRIAGYLKKNQSFLKNEDASRYYLLTTTTDVLLLEKTGNNYQLKLMNRKLLKKGNISDTHKLSPCKLCPVQVITRNKWGDLKNIKIYAAKLDAPPYLFIHLNYFRKKTDYRNGKEIIKVIGPTIFVKVFRDPLELISHEYENFWGKNYRRMLDTALFYLARQKKVLIDNKSFSRRLIFYALTDGKKYSHSKRFRENLFNLLRSFSSEDHFYKTFFPHGWKDYACDILELIPEPRTVDLLLEKKVPKYKVLDCITKLKRKDLFLYFLRRSR